MIVSGWQEHPDALVRDVEWRDFEQPAERRLARKVDGVIDAVPHE